MKKTMAKLLSSIVALMMVASVSIGLVACNPKLTPPNVEDTSSGTLVVAYSNFSEKFSPFFATSAYDVDVYTLTQVGLLAGDRGGNVIQKGIEGEVVPYNGKDYTYYGLSNLTITQNADKTVDYKIQMRTGDKTIWFSDGKPVTVKDAIFSMYVYSDPDYDGSTTFYSLPIEGMSEWRTGLSTDIYTKYLAIAEAIVETFDEDEADFVYAESDKYTKAQFDSLVAAINDVDGAWTALARDIVNYVAAKYPEYYGDFGRNEIAAGMGVWGFGEMGEDGSFTDSDGNVYTMTGDSVPTLRDYATCLKNAYENDLCVAAEVEAADGDFDAYVGAVIEPWVSEAGKDEMQGKTINSIKGITYDEKAGWINVRTTEFSATTIYQLTLSVSPLHYYGEESKWNPSKGTYGFTKGDLSNVRSKTTKPLGAGPYTFESYADGIVTFKANPNYWEGCPKTKYIRFKEYSSDPDKLPALIKGEVDIATPSINETVISQIKEENGSEELKVDGNLKVATDLVDYNGYGYIGINSDLVKVDAKDSDASKNLRKAFATLFAAYREYTVNSYYGDRASVIEYPITNCSWAAPQPVDEGYGIAFSKDVEGNAIYTADMTEEQKWAAAKTAAIGFLKAAGFTFDEATGKFTAAPEGARLEYEAIISGGGVGDHPTLALLNKAAEDLASIGITLTVTDIAKSSELFARMEGGTADIFIAAWGGASDPDMYQVYHSSNLTNSNHYHIADADLDDLIIKARQSADRNYRRATYKQCLDIVLDWAVEIPVYQRKDCTVYRSATVKISSITPDTTPFWSYLAEIHKVEVNSAD